VGGFIHETVNIRKSLTFYQLAQESGSRHAIDSKRFLAA
jgi:hypothetical protein